MKLFVVVGMPASGKNIGRSYAESNGVPYFSTGDIVRAEVRRRGIEPNPLNTAQVSDKMRGSDGMGVTRKALQAAIETGRETVFLEGMRSWAEIELIRQKADCTVIAFLAPKQTRRSRIQSRGRADDVADAFDERDAREISYGAAIPIALADAYVLNVGTVEEAIESFGRIIQAVLR